MKNRYKNPWFWVGLISIIISASGVNPSAFTSWNSLFVGIFSILKNPVQLTACVLAGLGVFIDPTTKGLKDGDYNENKL